MLRSQIALSFLKQTNINGPVEWRQHAYCHAYGFIMTGAGMRIKAAWPHSGSQRGRLSGTSQQIMLVPEMLTGRSL